MAVSNHACVTISTKGSAGTLPLCHTRRMGVRSLFHRINTSKHLTVLSIGPKVIMGFSGFEVCYTCSKNVVENIEFLCRCRPLYPVFNGDSGKYKGDTCAEREFVLPPGGMTLAA